MRAHSLPLEAPAALPLVHEGHGTAESGSSLLHYFFEPVHLPLTILIGILIGTAAWWWWTKRGSQGQR